MRRYEVPVAVVVAVLSLCLLAGVHPAAGALDGQKLFNERGCTVCHSVGEPSKGPGPELTQVAYQRSAEWLGAWLADPQKIKKDTIMPKPTWKSPEERDAVIEYLLHAKRAIPAADSTNGAKLFADYGCNACHAVRKQGGKPQFPDLTNEAKTRDAAWLDSWLADPPAVKKGTFMPRFPLTATQRKALIEYLLSLAKK